MSNRTRTYIAADWDEDSNLVNVLQKWNDSEYWSLSFPDAHELTQARDTTKACNIKKSLRARLDASKIFVLIVGKKTSSLRKGSCQYCVSYTGWCRKGYSTSTKSFIEYECEYAVRHGLKIVVLYNMSSPDRSLCPEVLRWTGAHLSAWHWNSGDQKYYWNYQAIKSAIMK